MHTNTYIDPEGSDTNHIDRQDLKSSQKFRDLRFDLIICNQFTDL